MEDKMVLPLRRPRKECLPLRNGRDLYTRWFYWQLNAIQVPRYISWAAASVFNPTADATLCNFEGQCYRD